MSDLAELPAHPRDAEPVPVRRNDDGSYYDDLAAFTDEQGYTVRQWRDANRCQGCGRCGWDPETGESDKVGRLFDGSVAPWVLRTRAECEAKRRIIAEHPSSGDEYEREHCRTCQWDVDCDWQQIQLRGSIRELAIKVLDALPLIGQPLLRWAS